jgi:hypothetical protein
MALIRRSPSNRTQVSPYSSTGGVTTGNAMLSSPYLAGKTPKEQTDLAKRTAYLQPTTADLAKGQFGAVTGGVTGSITLEQYQSQRTSLSATQTIGKQMGIQTAAVGPAPGGKGSVTPESFAAFRKDIELEEMFGMLGSGSAANIRLAAAQTGASITSLIALENKALGIRQETPIGKAAFQYQGVQYDKEGNVVTSTAKAGQTTGQVAGIVDLSAQSKVVSAQIKPSGGTTNLTEFQGIKIESATTTVKPTLNAPSSTVVPSTGGIATTTVALPSTNAGAQYKIDFVAKTGVDIYKPLIAPTTVKAIKDITGISQGKAPTLVLPDFMGKLTAPGELKGGKFEGVRYADLYQPVSPGATTFKLTAGGTAFRNLQIKGTPSINVRLR